MDSPGGTLPLHSKRQPSEDDYQFMKASYTVKPSQKLNSTFNIKNIEEILPKKDLITNKTVTERTIIAGKSS